MHNTLSPTSATHIGARHGVAAMAAAALWVLAPAMVQAQPVTPDPNGFVLAATGVLNGIGQGKVAEVWKTSSPEMQRLAVQKTFAKSINERYAPLGTAQAREWVGINRMTMPQPPKDAKGPTPPAGQYVNVLFQSAFANNRVMAERVTFYLDKDGTWRMIGVNVQ